MMLPAVAFHSHPAGAAWHKSIKAAFGAPVHQII